MNPDEVLSCVMMRAVSCHPKQATDDEDRLPMMNQGLCWMALPGEILMLLSAGLPRAAKSSARLTCKAWASWVARGCSQLRVRGDGPAEWGLRFSELEEMTLSIMTAEHDSDAVRRLCFTGLSRLQSLHLKILLKTAPSASRTTNPRKGTTCFSRETFEPLGQLTSLTGLHIEAYTSCGNIDTSWLESLRPVVQKLKSLKLRLIRADPGTALQLGHLSALTSLDLSGSNGITRVMLASISQLTPLEHLNLSSCITRIPSDVPFEDLRHLKSLLTLDVSLNDGIPNGQLAELRHLSTLRVLRLARCVQLTDLPGLRHLTSLTALDLSVCRRVTDAGVAELRALKALTDLNLSHCYKITDTGMAELKHLTALRVLSLRACWKITDSGLEDLSQLPQLANLDLSECTSGCITAAGVGMLTKRLVGLQVLNLDHVNITDKELEQLRALFPNAHLSRKMWTDSLCDLKLMDPDDDVGSLIS